MHVLVVESLQLDRDVVRDVGRPSCALASGAQQLYDWRCLHIVARGESSEQHLVTASHCNPISPHLCDSIRTAKVGLDV